MAQAVASTAGNGDGMHSGAAVRQPWTGILLVLAAAALATAPMVIRGVSCGNDFDFHLVSWIDALQSWRHGIVYPHWAASANFNAGEPRFVFYPPLVWMLGAALGTVLPSIAVPATLVFLLLAGTGLATRALAHEVLDEGPAALAGCVAIFSGYALYTVYARAAYAELAGGIWIPLMLLFMLREGGTGSMSISGEAAGVPQALKPRWFSDLCGATEAVPFQSGISAWRIALDGVPGLALVMAGAWLSNAPVGVMASYLLAAVALSRAAIDRSWTPVARAAAGMALGLGLAAVYLIPATVEQRWIDPSQAIMDPGERIANGFLFGHEAGMDPDAPLHDAELRRISWIAVGMIGGALLGAVVTWRRRRLPGARRWWLPLALIPAGVLVLLLPVSLPVWHLLPKLQFLQFPWRWLVAVEAPLGIFLATAVRTHSRRWMVWTAGAAACVGMTVLAGRAFFTQCYVEDSVPGMLRAYHAGAGFEGADEYSPEYADSSLIAMGLPGGCLVKSASEKLGIAQGDQQPQWSAGQGSCEQTIPFASGGDAEHWRVQGDAAHGGTLVLRLRAYPAWRVQVNGRTATNLPRRDDGLIAVPIEAGPLEVTADWTATPDVWAGRGISLAALVLVTGLCVLPRRRNRAQLS